MLPVLVVPSPLPRRHFGAAAGGVHPIITAVPPIRLAQLALDVVSGSPDIRVTARPGVPCSPAEVRDHFASDEGCRRQLVACRWPAWPASTAGAPMAVFRSLPDLAACSGPGTNKVLYAAE